MSLFLQRRKAVSLAGYTLALGAALSAAPLLADDQELPSPEEIVARYIEALGGEEAIRAHSSRTVNGGVEIPAMGMSGQTTAYFIAPDKMIVKGEMPGMGENVQAYNGEIGWVENPMAGAQVLEGDMLDQMKRQARFYADLERADLFPQQTTAGEAEWDGQAAYQLDVVDVDGNEMSQYFAKETGLLIGAEGTQTTEMGAMEVAITIGDYEEFGGVLIATSTSTNLVSMAMEIIATIESVTFDDVDPSVFEPSEAIKALLPE
ncbi:MAG: hypothetical protein F4X59_13215 [Holophagales bacterium]|nr:hypothetical protein [Holophagales bacterium]MXX61279.1 hypothetical protein [Holophagales bacterium]MYC11074.1 hypothetical protein [Holophagales bacterium]MYD22022.1 hypothetical protein [Holophagales bacterium]MYI34661.1 hypothetical protein [Holophagales bacterium]